MSVPDDRPIWQGREVARGADLSALRHLLADAIDRLVATLHYADAVKAGQQWTLDDLGLDCGFECELVLRVLADGTCTRGPEGLLVAGRR